MRVWFNETYRGTYQLIGLLRSAGHDLSVLGSHRIASTPFLQACDAVVEEPAGDGDAFVDAALACCRRYGVELFVPGRNMLAVARRVAEFTAAGVRVQVSPAESVAVLAGKTDTYRVACRLGVPVPRSRTVTDLAGFRAATAELSAGGHGICFKPDRDFGGAGFRVLDERADTFAELTEPPSVKIAPTTAERLLGSVGSFPPLVVSEYLAGTEISIDCLSSPEGQLLVALPRAKDGLPWTRELVDDEAAVAVARAMVEGLGLRYLSNVQVRYRDANSSEPVLLEVNTRAASGLYQSCLASGLNLPELALRMALGERPAVPAARAQRDRTVIVYNEAIPFRLPARPPAAAR